MGREKDGAVKWISEKKRRRWMGWEEEREREGDGDGGENEDKYVCLCD